jgi:2-polyprenyl-3-methyl-5-hydroxy-6-metoxy-1,4-benzoquinol methylase
MDTITKHQISHNLKSHNKYYSEYEQTHDWIFNPIEQKRILKKLKYAIKKIKTNSNPKIAFDYGCGSGNLTNHLIDLGVNIIAADISEKFLKNIGKKHSRTGLLQTLRINGQDLSNINDDVYDLIATYSVLHHVPDYLFIIEEMVRVLKPGGIIYLDHEVNELFWNRNKQYIEFLKLTKVKPKRDFKRFFRFSYYYNNFRKMVNPRFKELGDIHIWPDDHIEWDKIEKLLKNQGCKIVLKEDYLVYKKEYPIEIYQEFKNKCKDVRLLIARKKNYS